MIYYRVVGILLSSVWVGKCTLSAILVERCTQPAVKLRTPLGDPINMLIGEFS